MDGVVDGTLIDQYRYMMNGANMDWVRCCDDDNGAGRECSWWILRKLIDIYCSVLHFVRPLNFERKVHSPESHRNAICAQRGIRSAARLPTTSDAPVLTALETCATLAWRTARPANRRWRERLGVAAADHLDRTRIRTYRNKMAQAVLAASGSGSPAESNGL